MDDESVPVSVRPHEPFAIGRLQLAVHADDACSRVDGDQRAIDGGTGRRPLGDAEIHEDAELRRDGDHGVEVTATDVDGSVQVTPEGGLLGGIIERRSIAEVGPRRIAGNESLRERDQLGTVRRGLADCIEDLVDCCLAVEECGCELGRCNLHRAHRPDRIDQR